MNPSTAFSLACPARYAASAAAQISRGSSKPRFKDVDTSAWNSTGSPAFIASWNVPKLGSRFAMKSSSAARACAPVTGKAKSAATPT